jgi:hypothetical protein
VKVARERIEKIYLALVIFLLGMAAGAIAQFFWMRFLHE